MDQWQTTSTGRRIHCCFSFLIHISSRHYVMSPWTSVTDSCGLSLITTSSFHLSRTALHPYLLLGLYQASPPSALLTAILIWQQTIYGGGNIFFSDGKKFEPLTLQILSAPQNVCSHPPKLLKSAGKFAKQAYFSHFKKSAILAKTHFLMPVVTCSKL